jgi:putative oxidoreductase
MFKVPFPSPDKSLPQIWSDLASLILRAGMAVVFVYHGLDKILGEQTEWGANWMSGWFGVSPETFGGPSLAAIQLIVAWGEVLGGTALGLGLLTRLAALGLIVIQTAAAGFAIAHNAFSMSKAGGPEYNFVLLAVCLALVLLGPGRFSVDAWLKRFKKPETEAKPAATPDELVAATH